MNEKKPKNPVEETEGSPIVLRGGTWDFYPKSIRSASRGSTHPFTRYYGSIGFRIARTKK